MNTEKKFIVSENFIFLILTIISALLFKATFARTSDSTLNDYLSYLCFEVTGNKTHIAKHGIVYFVTGWASFIIGAVLFLGLITYIIILIVNRDKSVFIKYFSGKKLSAISPLISAMTALLACLACFNLTIIAYNNDKYNALIIKMSEPSKVIEMPITQFENTINLDDGIIFVKNGKFENETYISHIVDNIYKETPTPVYIYNSIYDKERHIENTMSKYDKFELPAVIIVKQGKIENIICGDELMFTADIWFNIQ